MSYIYNLTDTWNAAGTTFAGIKMAVTNTASGASSKLLDITVSGATTGSFSVDKSGNVSISGALTLGTQLSSGNGGTGLTSFTSGYIPYASSSSQLSFSSAIYSNGTSVGIGTTSVNPTGTSRNFAVFGSASVSFSLSTTAAMGAYFSTDGASYAQFVTPSAIPILLVANNAERLRVDSLGNVVVNTAAVATNATNGFLYVPTCAGAPTGTPTSYPGRAPIVVDSTNNKLYFYSGGAWRDAGP